MVQFLGSRPPSNPRRRRRWEVSGGIDVSAFNGEIPPGLNSGKGVDGTGDPVPFARTQIAVTAQTNKTVLIRLLNAAYNDIKVTFPFDVVIIAYDGRALGVPPFGNYNNAFVVPAGTSLRLCTARRFDALMRTPDTTGNHFVTVEFHDSQGADVPPGELEPHGPLLVTARIPVNIVEGAPEPPVQDDIITVLRARFNPRNRRLQVRATSSLGLDMIARLFTGPAGETLLPVGPFPLDDRGRLNVVVPGVDIPTFVEVLSHRGTSGKILL